MLRFIALCEHDTAPRDRFRTRKVGPELPEKLPPHSCHKMPRGTTFPARWLPHSTADSRLKQPGAEVE